FIVFFEFQIIDHDLTLTASTRASTGEGLHCCHEEARRATKIRHPACKPILIPRDDPFYSQHNHFCNNFVRNAAGPKYDCNLGKLRVDKVNGYEFLPFDTQNRSDECEWSDESIYQETRRIVAAEIQTITYNEWMPLIIGRSVMKEFNLLTKPNGYTYDYDNHLNPGIFNEFATAVYRFHTLIQGLLRLLNNAGQVTQTIQLRKHFNNPSAMYRKGAFDEFLNGYTGNPTQTFDQFFTEDITNHLFQEHNSRFGMDLIALNIQRVHYIKFPNQMA
ncbi:unnamed protein product, partial [Oppiella nova]